MKKLIVATAISMLLAGSAMADPMAPNEITDVNFAVNLLGNPVPTCSATLSTTEATVFWRTTVGNYINSADSDNVEFDGTPVVVAVEQSAARVTAIMGELPDVEGIQFELVSYNNNGVPVVHDQDTVLDVNAGERVSFEVHGFLKAGTTMAEVAGDAGFEKTYTLPISYACN